MRPPDRKEAEARALLLAGLPQPVPPDLAARAVARGARLARRRRTVHALLCVLLLGAAVALASWAAVARPWEPAPSETTTSVGW